MPSSTYIYFGIRGDFAPDELAAKIGIVPTASAAKHSRDLAKKLPKRSILRFAQTHADDSHEVLDIYVLGETVYNELKNHKNQIAEVVKAHDVKATFQVVLYFPISDDVSMPAIGFSKEVVNFIAEVGASIDIDSYRE